jgi:hypothetical protein
MAFDPRAYHRDVVAPLRNHPGGLPPNDLLRQYAVDPAMSRAELTDHLTRIRRLWNQKSGGADMAVHVYGQLLSRDEELRTRYGDDLNDPLWWQERSADREAEIRAESKLLAEDLKRAYGALGRLTQSQLDVIAAHWPGLSKQGIDEAVRLADLKVREPIALPGDSGMGRTAYRALAKNLDHLGLPTVVQLLHPDLGGTPFRLLDGAGRIPLGADLVDQRIRETNAAAGTRMTQFRKDALGLVRTAVQGGADLHTVALVQVVAKLDAGRATGMAVGMLVKIAVDAGLDRTDAQAVVASLGDTSAPVSAAARISDLVRDGELLAAQRELAVLPPTDEAWQQVHDLVEGLVAQVRSLRREADEALREGREEDAGRLLRDAVVIAGDDPDLAGALERLPPPPPRNLVARPQDSGVRLVWEAPRTGATQFHYRVVRAERPPRSVGDGEPVVDATRPEGHDGDPPVARELHYAVFASTGGEWSRPATATATVVPPVFAVQVRVQPEAVSCGWRLHRAVETVRVRRTVGRPPALATDGSAVDASRTGFVDPVATDQTDRFYGIVAVYRDPQGREVTAPMVVAQVSPRRDAPAYVDRVRLHLTANDAGTATVQVSWTTPATGTVSIRRAASRPDWPAGTTIKRDEVNGYGEPVVGDRLVQGPETLVEATVPSGQFVYVPFTVNATAGTAIVGEVATLNVTQPVQQLQVRRTGDQVNVAWVWPPALTLVDVEYIPPGGTPTRRRISRGQFAESGCYLPVEPAGGRITVRGVSRNGPAETLSAPVSTTVEGRTVTIEYHLDRTGGPFSRTRQLRVSVDRRCHDVELVLEAASGPAMPARPGKGTILASFTQLTLEPDAPWIVPFELPRLVKPYWLRCFVVRPDGVRVVDPVNEMKVS